MILGGQDLADLLAFAHHLADLTDAITLPLFTPAVVEAGDRDAARVTIHDKPDGTPVTDADRDAEQAIRDAVAASHPGHGVLGEEHGLVGDAGVPTWVVDPIDGTQSFITGNPLWATQIALVDDAGVAVTVISAPAMGHRWDGVRGGPARRDGQPIHVSAVTDLARSQVSLGDLSSFDLAGCPHVRQRLTDATIRQRAYGDFWGFCLVAEGVMDIAAEAIASVWDYAAVKGLVEAAGGRFTTFDGQDSADGPSGLATNGLLHPQVLSCLTTDVRTV